MTRRRAGSARGFTLIEIVMVVALMGLIAAIAIPRVDFTSYRVNSAVRGASAVLQRAQRLAVTNQSNVNVLFDTTHQAIRIHEDLNNDNIVQSTERVRAYPVGEGVLFGLGGAPQRLYTAPISFTRMQGGAMELIFRRDGSASENGGFYLTTAAALNAARPSDARSVEVTRSTGRVDWYQYDGARWVRKF